MIGPMPYLSHPPISQLIKSLPEAEHSVEVDAGFWASPCAQAGLQQEHAAIFGNHQKVRISRRWLRNPSPLSPTTRTLAILLWGYPQGALGARHRHWLKHLPQIAEAAQAKESWDSLWTDYYNGLARIGGLGISTISKLAHFWGYSAMAIPAQILDQRIIRVMSMGRWTDLHELGSYDFRSSPSRYLGYLERLGAIADNIGAHPAQIEFFLCTMGDAF